MSTEQKALTLLPTSAFHLLCLYLPIVDVFSHYLCPFVQAVFHSKEGGSSRCEWGLWAWTHCHSYYCYHSSENQPGGGLALWNLFCCFNCILVECGKWNESGMKMWKGEWSAVLCTMASPKGAALASEVLSCCGARFWDCRIGTCCSNESGVQDSLIFLVMGETVC